MFIGEERVFTVRGHPTVAHGQLQTQDKSDAAHFQSRQNLHKPDQRQGNGRRLVRVQSDVSKQDAQFETQRHLVPPYR